MKNSVIYLTRRCPRQCGYCAIRDNSNKANELSIDQWVRAFAILEELKVEFNLILGNEPWLLGVDLLRILKTTDRPTALYTTCVPSLFTRYRNWYFDNGVNNLSAGVDWPILRTAPIEDDSYQKSLDAWWGFEWVKEHYPKIECHATVTVHKLNYKYLPQIIDGLTELGVYGNVNFIHWNKDGNFDFFSEQKDMLDLLFTPEDYPALQAVMDEVLSRPGLLQNPELLELNPAVLATMGWHCQGDPYGGPTIDADGSLRVCGYRKGTRTPAFSIFDLPEKVEEWKEAVHADAMECPGCTWSCAWMYGYWKQKNPEMGTQVFAVHARDFQPKKKEE